jgi:hypothetical protein
MSENMLMWSNKRHEMGEACSTNGEKINAHRILFRIPEAKTLLGESGSRLASTA